MLSMNSPRQLSQRTTHHQPAIQRPVASEGKTISTSIKMNEKLLSSEDQVILFDSLIELQEIHDKMLKVNIAVIKMDRKIFEKATCYPAIFGP
jgi:hypothetical protein